jgi:hypothetical protein
MSEVPQCWDFDATVDEPSRALAKYFSHAGRITHFLAHTVMARRDLDDAEKERIEGCFSVLCPRWVPHRWHYRFKFFKWILERRVLIIDLVPRLPGDTSTDNPQTADAFTGDEMLLLEMVAGTDEDGQTYWCKLECTYAIDEWGWRTNSWMHGCTRALQSHMDYGFVNIKYEAT